MRQISMSLILGPFVVVFATMTLAGGPELEPGKWDITRTVTTTHGAEPRTTTDTSCLRAADVQDPVKLMAAGEGCETKDRSESGRKVEWVVECHRQGAAARMLSKGEIEARGDSAEGRSEVTMTMGAQSVTTTTMWKGKRVGNCE